MKSQRERFQGRKIFISAGHWPAHRGCPETDGVMSGSILYFSPGPELCE